MRMKNQVTSKQHFKQTRALSKAENFSYNKNKIENKKEIELSKDEKLELILQNTKNAKIEVSRRIKSIPSQFNLSNFTFGMLSDVVGYAFTHYPEMVTNKTTYYYEINLSREKFLEFACDDNKPYHHKIMDSLLRLASKPIAKKISSKKYIYTTPPFIITTKQANENGQMYLINQENKVSEITILVFKSLFKSLLVKKKKKSGKNKGQTYLKPNEWFLLPKGFTVKLDSLIEIMKNNKDMFLNSINEITSIYNKNFSKEDIALTYETFSLKEARNQILYLNLHQSSKSDEVTLTNDRENNSQKKDMILDFMLSVFPSHIEIKNNKIKKRYFNVLKLKSFFYNYISLMIRGKNKEFLKNQLPVIENLTKESLTFKKETYKNFAEKKFKEREITKNFKNKAHFELENGFLSKRKINI